MENKSLHRITMNIIRKFKMHNFLGAKTKICRYYFFNIPFLQYIKDSGEKKWSLIKAQGHSNQRIFYLKVNRIHRTSFTCIQRWTDLAHELNAFVYFVCDNKKLEYDILTNIWFHNLNFKFIPSDRKSLKKTIERIIVAGGAKWQKIAYSMITPFLHAAKYDFKHTYNIDADDIEILLRPKLIAKAFKKAEKYAENKKLDCFNLDMFVSRSFGTHWSFGCVYVRTPKKCIEVIKKNENWQTSQNLIEKFKTFYVLDTSWHDDNIDWLFTFLRDTHQLKLETFYIENAYVVHMPDIILEHEWAFYLHWNNGFVYHPILLNEYNDKRWYQLPIPNYVYKIDINLTDEDKFEYMNEYHYCDSIFREHCLYNAYIRNKINQKLYEKYQNFKKA